MLKTDVEKLKTSTESIREMVAKNTEDIYELKLDRKSLKIIKTDLSENKESLRQRPTYVEFDALKQRVTALELK